MYIPKYINITRSAHQISIGFILIKVSSSTRNPLQMKMQRTTEDVVVQPS